MMRLQKLISLLLGATIVGLFGTQPTLAFNPAVPMSLYPSPQAFLTFQASPSSLVSPQRRTSTSALANHGHGHGGEHHELPIDVNQLGVLGDIVKDPTFWLTTIILSIVFLLYSWDEILTNARKKLPDTLQPVISSMLAEMGALGFVGIFLGLVVIDGPLGLLIEEVSEVFLGEGEILLETFEFLHTAFFDVGIAFFAVAGITVWRVVKQVESLEMVSRAVFDLDGDGDVTLSEIAEVLNVESVAVDLDGDGVLDEEEIALALEIAPRPTFWGELTRSSEKTKGEALVVRERLLELHDHIPEEAFQMESYFVKIFGKNLEEMVELSPFTWLPLIPVVAVGGAIDLSRDVVSSTSPNAFLSCGEFISSPFYLVTSVLTAAVALTWGCWNFWKMVKLKDMLVPTLVRDGAMGGEAVLLPPRYEDKDQMAKYNSSPFPFNLIESIWGTPAKNDQEKLFGAAGHAGPELYRESIKLHTWFVVAQLVFWSGQVVNRDIRALLEGVPSSVGQPDMLVPELILYGTFCVSAAFQLWLVPKTFLDYTLVTSVEKLVSAEILTDACIFDGECEVPESMLPDDEVATATTASEVPTTAAKPSEPSKVPAVFAASESSDVPTTAWFQTELEPDNWKETEEWVERAQLSNNPAPQDEKVVAAVKEEEEEPAKNTAAGRRRFWLFGRRRGGE